MKEQEIIDMLKHYYEVDLDNCEMSHEQWIKEVAEALTNPKYLDEMKEEYDEYLADREEEDGENWSLDKQNDLRNNVEIMVMGFYNVIGIDVPNNHDKIFDFIVEDVMETTTVNAWSSEDIRIAFRRSIETNLYLFNS